MFLEMEAFRLYGKVRALDRLAMPTEDVQCAQQINSSDCGCYLLMFVEELFKVSWVCPKSNILLGLFCREMISRWHVSERHLVVISLLLCVEFYVIDFSKNFA